MIQLSVEWTATRLELGDAAVELDTAIEAASDMVTRYLFR